LDFGTGHDVFSGEECGGLQYFTLCFSYYDNTFILWCPVNSTRSPPPPPLPPNKKIYIIIIIMK
jgi:hypothetical protein